jgi:hypothetical protein
MGSFKSIKQDQKMEESLDPPAKKGHAVFGHGANFKIDDFKAPPPTGEEVIKKEGILQKRINQGSSWTDRFIMLTSDKIFIRNEAGGDVRDVLELLKITHATRMVEDSKLRSTKTIKTIHDPNGIRGSPQPHESPSPMSVGSLASTWNLPTDRKLVQRAEWEWQNVIEIYEEFYGRSYYLRASSGEECEEWVNAINEAIKEAWSTFHSAQLMSLGSRLQTAARQLYDNSSTQMAISLLLFCNFVVGIVQTEAMQKLDEGVKASWEEAFELFELVFTFIYSCELALNLYGHWFWPFFSNWWCWFDLIIVTLSLSDALYVLSGGEGTAGLNAMRLLRIFRIVRIFNKLEDMKRILNANFAAFGPVLNAFLLFVVVISIYSVNSYTPEPRYHPMNPNPEPLTHTPSTLHVPKYLKPQP